MDRFVVRTKKRKEETNEETPTQKKKKLFPENSQADSETSNNYNFKIQNLGCALSEVTPEYLKWTKIRRDNLDLDYTILLSKTTADNLLEALEKEVDYFTGDMAQIKVFGKWHNIPRKHATYGDPGLSYKYSGQVTPARPWPSNLAAVKNLVCRITGFNFNFVLVNRYENGKDKMGEHKDDERELDPNTPIASLSLGQVRDFYFKHQDTRPPKKLKIEKVQLRLEHGSLLLMNTPTNQFWYHALPPRSSAEKVRINLTFRKVVPSKKP